MKYKLETANKEHIDTLIKYKLANIFEYAENLPEEEINRINQYVYSKIPVQLKDYKIILVNNNVIGCVLVEKYKDGFLLDEIYLESIYRSKGIGTKILTEILKNNIVYLWVYKNNTQAIKLYKKLGFQIKETTETRYFMKYDKS